ncbi:MAG: MoxR family ATPase [Dehalococcoidia bacterium]|nr:MoxR family ATPase [Dehalococcoidia bacterium]
MTDIQKVVEVNRKLKNALSSVIVGKDEVKEMLVLALIAGGHVLIEGMPGTAKTKLAKTFAGIISGEFKRIQFTPDMMPADVTGFYLYSPNGDSRFTPGPIFANVVLADELNRTTPRTQAALIEAMQEHQVTIERETLPLSLPFMVVATQVAYGGEGTYPLTDVQLDRFLLKATSRYPSKAEEEQILNNIDSIDDPHITAITSLKEIRELQEMVKRVQVSPSIVEYITSLIGSLRGFPGIQSGPSSRGAIALYKCSRVRAMLEGRDFVIPDDVKHLMIPAVEHRIKIKPESEMDDVTPGMALEWALEQVPVPKLKV